MTKSAIEWFLNNKPNQIFLIHLDGGDVYVGYPDGVKTSDLSVETIGESDVLAVKRTSKYLGEEIKYTTYHDVGTVFSIGVVDDSNKDKLPDPFLI